MLVKLVVLFTSVIVSTHTTGTGCRNDKFLCVDGSCVDDQKLCHHLNSAESHENSRERAESLSGPSQTCPQSHPVKCHERCISIHVLCDGYCDCANCSDESVANCHYDVHQNSEARQGQVLPTGTLMLAAVGLVLYSIYVYFRRKLRMARMQNTPALHIDDSAEYPVLTSSSLRTPGYPTNTASLATMAGVHSNHIMAANRLVNINIHSDRAEVNQLADAPPAYSEVVTDSEYRSSLLQPQRSIPPPPSYDSVASGDAEPRNNEGQCRG